MTEKQQPPGDEEAEKCLLEKVGHVISSINGTKHVDQLISTLHSLASLLFPIDSPSLLGCISEKYIDEVRNVRVVRDAERSENCKIFYGGAAFRTLARVLLYDVASDWLACFPIFARKHVYDVFFVNGRVIEVVQTLVPCLQHTGGVISHSTSAVYSNAERLLVLCLLENNGVLQITRDFAASVQREDLTIEQLKQAVSSVAQLITSIPDKARPAASTSLSSHTFFKQITAQLLAGAEEFDETFCAQVDKSYVNAAILFIGEAFARICRRGSTDVLLNEMIPRLLRLVKSIESEATDMDVVAKFEPKPGLSYWSKIMQAINDSYSMERMSERLLHQLAAQNASDTEAYWIMQILYYHIYKHRVSIRSMFTDRFLLWKVFPVRCLSWIIHFAIIECKPGTSLQKEAYDIHILLDTVQRLASAWSRLEFVQSAPVEQQAYVTAALGLCLEKMSKKDLDAAKDAMPLILQGVSCRLESVDYLIRRTASSIALVFSKVIDPQNPLYLDDSCHEDVVDWEFGLAAKETQTAVESHLSGGNANEAVFKKVNHTKERQTGCRNNIQEKKASEQKIVDPDEIVDPAMLTNNLVQDDDENYNSGEDSDTSSDSSLQPYDLSDDDADLKRKFSQIVDVVGALRKSDDADAVQGALDVAEKLIRASPDELRYVAAELVRVLITVRCSDSTVEGEEESAEEKRQKALAAMVVTCPLESLDTLNKLLYSPKLDVSQRIMILDIMTEAAEELAHTKTSKPGNRPANLVSSVSDQPWFAPRNIGPPGAGSWKELPTPGTPLNWSHAYERELPAKTGQIRKGKTRRWSLKSSIQENQLDWAQNRFPQYAAAFMLPAMQGFDKKRHGVDLLGGDYIVLGRLIYMLGICMKCAAMHPEASVLASPLLDMLSSRAIFLHKEAYVRRSVLFAASCTLVALQPSYVASSLTEGNGEIAKGLEWIRTYALQVAESDIDKDCYMLAIRCLQLHSEMALQASRALEMAGSSVGVKTIRFPSNITKGTIRIPH